MKEFDFTHPDFLRHQENVRNWLKKHHHKPVTENEYIIAMKELRNDISGKRARRNRCPSNLKRGMAMTGITELEALVAETDILEALLVCLKKKYVNVAV